MNLKILLLSMPFLTLTLQADEYVNKPLEQVKTLLLNTENKTRLYTHKTLEEGLDDLQIIAQTQAHEEFYAFFPKQELWIEVGHGEEFIQREGYKAHSSVALDEYSLYTLVKKLGLAKVYHTHPDKELKKIGKIEQRKAPSKQTKEIIRLLGKKTIYPNNARPSTRDVKNLLSRKKQYKKTLGLCDYHVVSPKHIAQYSIQHLVPEKQLFDDLESKTNQDTLYIKSFAMTMAIWPRTQDNSNHYNYK